MPDFRPVREANTIVPLQITTIFKQTTSPEAQKRTPQVIWQDKRRLDTARLMVGQPAAGTKNTRAAVSYNRGVRSQNQTGDAAPAGRITIWGIDQSLKAELERIAARDRISLSAAGLALIRRAIRKDIDLQYTATLEPMFQKILARYLNNRDSRIISLLVRIAFDSGQTRAIATNILGLQPDISPDLLRDILAESNKTARSNIMKKTPQITELTEALKNWSLNQTLKKRRRWQTKWLLSKQTMSNGG